MLSLAFFLSTFHPLPDEARTGIYWWSFVTGHRSHDRSWFESEDFKGVNSQPISLHSFRLLHIRMLPYFSNHRMAFPTVIVQKRELHLSIERYQF
jgi:hypothetical protein